VNKKYLVASLIIVGGCATQLTTEGSSVRLVDDKDNCEYRGIVAGSNALGVSTADDAEGAMNDLRNKAAAIGANAVYIMNIDSDIDSTTAVAEALICKFD
jgi:hypothetical protein